MFFHNFPIFWVSGGQGRLLIPVLIELQGSLLYADSDSPAPAGSPLCFLLFLNLIDQGLTVFFHFYGRNRDHSFFAENKSLQSQKKKAQPADMAFGYVMLFIFSPGFSFFHRLSAFKNTGTISEKGGGRDPGICPGRRSLRIHKALSGLIGLCCGSGAVKNILRPIF